MPKLFLLLATVIFAVPAAGDDTVSFSRQIRGILSDRCFQCHGPDEAQRQADLRLDNQESAVAELDSGARAIVPGDAAASELIHRLTTDDPDLRMPPVDFSKTVSDEEIALIRTWVDQGAEWGKHWAFEPIVRPEPPSSDVQPIDAFVAARLQREDLQGSPQADPIGLLRRVSLDLTGLPPTPAEVDSFLEDSSPDAYELAVDRLLESTRYGEHMSRYWLDVARYGDTHGLHLDNFREMWAYRDWVVSAFNSNKPYDVFVTEQLAGDLLPDATQDQLIASGFNRCNVTTGEGGSIAEEVHVRNVIDRVVTTGTAFMALTMDCTRCHDHKFDPLTMNDFYSFYAFFNSLDGNPMDGNKKDHAPTIRVLTTDQQTQLNDLTKTQDTLEAKIHGLLAKVDYYEPASLTQRIHDKPTDYIWIEDTLPADSKTTSKAWKFAGDPQPVFSGKFSNELVATGVEQNVVENVPEKLIVAEGDTLFCHVYVDPENPPQQIMLQFHADNWEHRAYWGENLISWGTDNSPSRFHVGGLPDPGEWVRLEVKAADVGLTPGTSIDGWACTQQDGRVFWDHAGIRGLTDRTPWYDSFAVWLKEMRSIGGAPLPEHPKALITRQEAELNKDEIATLKMFFLRYAWTVMKEPLAPLLAKLDDIHSQMKAVHDQAGTTLVYKETEKPKPAYLLTRGEYDHKGEEVSRGVPAVLPGFPQDAPNNRLGLAKWLTSSNHPLTSRVAVNRLWQQFFGVGLVKTSEDFGSQGEPPSHPLLLDWLSAEFMAPQQSSVQHAWNVKHLTKQIVMSATYRQSAVVTLDLLQRDPENRLLARGPRFRLDAETLRDQALFISGLLHEETGGPSVKPPQPKGLWNAVGYTNSNTANFSADKGHESVHRRTLYTFIKRTSPPPQMSTFDGPSRESCVVRRERSNSPMQALLLMNDPQYVECARGLAERVLREPSQTEQKQAEFVLRQCILRQPTEQEVQGVLDDYHSYLADFTADPTAAKSLVQVGENPPAEDLDSVLLAAWTMVSNLALNLDEFINK